MQNGVFPGIAHAPVSLAHTRLFWNKHTYSGVT